ncbi:aminotransferase class V-fold PLP-dependent enzyme [Homoserinibacter sp. YIM 151385]|uniref:aminotransferase class V-fold PLP-dependent enzyme n=1 Tax=Homoserinibacter sp. YIM 151385 TaxID=2985506 RepID=UPI0022F0F9C4|nr:SufS family cysteine desulfurase [Homoserinibacter sp. YIM 151385]WBU38215.1 SufS family cysteine desulfurase [Homoserinibacter sp. YIM 151385]
MTTTTSTAPLSDDEIRRIRADFPILGESVNGRPLVYLDSGATSQRPRTVLDAEREFAEHRNSAVHRGAHTLAAEATEEFEQARERIAGFVGVGADEVVWTANATAGLNLVAYALSNAAVQEEPAMRELALEPGDEILVTELEHHANLVPWQQLALRTGAVLRFIPVDDDGALVLDELDALLGERTRVVALAHVSNVIGTVSPIAPVIARAREVGALVVLDACQSAPQLPLDLRALDVDLAVFSGHKMLGPSGVGVLAGRREILAALPPVTTGGSVITRVTMERSEFLPPPQRFEAGTQPVSQAVGLAAAVDYLESLGMDRVAAHERELGAQMVDGLAAIPGVRVLRGAPGAERVGLASFALEGVHAHDLGQFLDDRGIAIRVGHHCAQPLHRRLGLTATARMSAAVYTTAEEVELALAAVRDAAGFFGVRA